MDIVYLFKDWGEGDELRVSLRSVEKHLKGYDKVWVVGMTPTWLTNVQKLEVKDINKKHKQINAINKLIEVCKQEDLSNNFLLMNDDFFFLKDTDIKKIKQLYWYDLSFLKKKYESCNSKYYHNTRRTIELLNDFKAKNYELHYPMVINKKKFLNIFEELNWKEEPILHRSTYGYISAIKGKSVKSDFKAYSYDEFNELKEGEFISITDKLSTNIGFRWWIRDTFGKKSKFEVDSCE